MYATNQFRKGLKIEIEGTPFEIVDFQHVSPGKGSAFTRTKLRNLINQNVIERTFKSGDKVDRPDLIEAEVQYLYNDSEGFHFMNTASYEQLVLDRALLAEKVGFMQENALVKILLFNDRPIVVDLPNFVVLRVKQTDPAHKGDTVTGGTKPAKLETGATVNVPFHISEGDLIKVDTRSSTYVEKA